MKGTTVMAAKEEGLSLHVDIGGIIGKGSDFVCEEDGRRVEVLANAVPHNTSKLLNFFPPHLRLGFSVTFLVKWDLS